MTTTSTLKLGRGLTLPLDAVTETFGFIGNRGSGKTFAAKVMAEEMLKVGAQIVVLDPVDAWYGLRFGAQRGRSGLPVYVFGGAHGDAPLESTAGALLADVVVEHGISAVFSLRHLPKTQQRRFVKDFAERLYLRKGEEKYRSAIHVFIEEAHTFAPQTQGRGEDVACLGAIQDLVLQGRGSGIGVSLVTQRVAVLSKAVLELAEVMFAFRTTGPNARKALKDWFAAQDGDDHLAEFLGALVSLPQGECWLWSPGYLNLFKHVAIRMAETFDSSATPKGGQRRPTPSGKAAPLDLDALGEEIRETRERVQANDPKKLHARIKELEQQLAKRPEGTKVEEVIKVEREVVEVISPEIEEFLDALLPVVGHLQDAVKADLERLHGLTTRIIKFAKAKPERRRSESKPVIERVLEKRGASTTPITTTNAPIVYGGVLSKQAQAFLVVIAQREPVHLTEQQLSTMSGYKRSSSSFRPSIKELVSAGYVSKVNGLLHLTEAGRMTAGVDEMSMQSAEELLDLWVSRFPRQAADFLRLIAKHGTMTKDELDEQTTYSRTSSSFDGSLRMLKQNGVITIDGDVLTIVEELVA